MFQWLDQQVSQSPFPCCKFQFNAGCLAYRLLQQTALTERQSSGMHCNIFYELFNLVTSWMSSFAVTSKDSLHRCNLCTNTLSFKMTVTHWSRTAINQLHVIIQYAIIYMGKAAWCSFTSFFSSLTRLHVSVEWQAVHMSRLFTYLLREMDWAR